MTAGTIRAGMGGWTFEPWEGTFYPEKLAEEEAAGIRLAAGADHRSQRHLLFRLQAGDLSPNGRAETPDDFVFSIKGNRFVTNRKVLAEAGESMEKFFAQGWRSSATKLGPIVWQFAPTKKFDAEDFGAF